MLFGFAVAVIVGFLLTAGKAWTGLATPRGAVLGALAGLWLAARLAAVFAPYAVYAALDLLLLPLVAAILITCCCAPATGATCRWPASCCCSRGQRLLPLRGHRVSSTSSPCMRCTPGWHWW
jgi:hypothetical protein